MKSHQYIIISCLAILAIITLGNAILDNPLNETFGSGINNETNTTNTNITTFNITCGNMTLENITLNWYLENCSENNSWCNGGDVTQDGGVDIDDISMFAMCIHDLNNTLPEGETFLPPKEAVKPSSSGGGSCLTTWLNCSTKVISYCYAPLKDKPICANYSQDSRNSTMPDVKMSNESVESIVGIPDVNVTEPINNGDIVTSSSNIGKSIIYIAIAIITMIIIIYVIRKYNNPAEDYDNYN